MRARVRLPTRGRLLVRLGGTPALRTVAADLEPTAIHASAALRTSVGRWLTFRVEDRRGDPLGAVVLHRLGFGQWEAIPLVVDDRSAPVLGRIVRWSPSNVVMGVGPHVAPLVPHLGRVRSVGRVPFIATPQDTIPVPADLDPRTRLASPADVDATARLFARSYHLGRSRDLASWTRRIREIVADGFAVVGEVDGEIVAGTLCDAVGERWAYASDGVVRDDHRGRGLSWAMIDRLVAVVGVRGLTVCASIVGENPMEVDHHYDGQGAPVDELWGVALDPVVPWPSMRWRRRQARRISRWSRRARSAVAEQRARR